MIAGILHEGSGLGDQLFRYITVRTLAEEKGFEFAVFGKENFKGDSFMNLDMGHLTEEVLFNGGLLLKKWLEKDIRDENGVDIRSFDPEIHFVGDGSLIDGSFEDDKYWRHNLDNISKWLAVEPLNVPDDLCVIGFRGGEYATQPDLFLGEDYWRKAIAEVVHKGNGRINKFQVHTDDPELAESSMPLERHLFEVVDNVPISHSKHTNMGFNWRSARYAKYAIIPNSAFYILPRILKHNEDPTSITIAPRYWARRNTKTWARPACYYKEFTYL